MNYEKLIPTVPPEDMQEWAKRQFKKEYLIYKVEYIRDPLTDIRTKYVKCSCTACHESVYCQHISFEAGCWRAQGPKFGFIHPETREQLYSGTDTLCPLCGKEVSVIHIGSMRDFIFDNFFAMSFDRIAIPEEKDRFVLIGWTFRRKISKDAESKYFGFPYEAFVVEERKMIRLNAYVKCLSSVSLLGHWQQRQKLYDTWGASAIYGIPQTDGTTAENSALDKMLQAKDATPVKYLRLWQKHRNAENIVVQGLGTLLQEMIDEGSHQIAGYYGNFNMGMPKVPDIDWKQKSPMKMLGMNREEFRVCIKQNWSLKDFRKFRLLMKNNVPFDVKKDDWMIRDFSIYALTGLVEDKHVGSVKPVKVLRYLHKQQKDYSTLRDYWNMAEGNGVALTTERLLLPKDLQYSHDYQLQVRNEREELERSIRRKKEIESRQVLFAKRSAELQKFEWAFGGYLIEACPDEEALIREGKILEHCVATYAARICKGDSAIFFIRRQKSPDEPFYTLELDEKTLTVRQNRGKRNCERTAAVQKFEDRWLEHIRSLPAKKREVKTA